MLGDQIAGEWKSVAYAVNGDVRPYDRQMLTLHSNGTGVMLARTLFKRKTTFSWDYDGFEYCFYDLGGPGSRAFAGIEDGRLIVLENGMVMVYERA